MGVIRIDGHPLPELEGDGNCRECTFVGDAAALGIRPRDVVSVQWSEDGGATWRTRYTGVAVVTGSTQKGVAGNFKLTGLMKKLEEAETRLPLAKGDLTAQAQALITNTLASGQWDTLISPTLIAQGVPAITSGAVIPNYQSVASVFKDVLCKRADKLRVAVNADRQVLFGIPTGTLDVDELTPGVRVEWQDVTSEELVTDVRLQWTTGMTASFYFSQPSDGSNPTPKLEAGSPPMFSVLQHCTDLVASGGSVGSGTAADNWPYGTAIRSEGMPLDALDFNAQASTYGMSTNGSSPSMTGDYASLADYDPSTGVTLSATFAGGTGNLFGILMHQDVATLPHGFRIVADKAAVLSVVLRLNTSSSTYNVLTCYITQMHPSGVFLLPDSIRAAAQVTPFTSIDMEVTLSVTATSVFVRTCCPVGIGDVANLTARAMARQPSPAAASITLPGWVDPQPNVRIQRRGPNMEPLDVITLPGSLYRYQPGGPLPGDGSAVGLQTTIQIGQPDTAEQMGITALIKYRDREATARAVTVAS